jgi:DNA-binding response OmpR family regulator
MYLAALAAMASDEGWTARSHASFTELFASVETTGADVVVISYSDVPHSRQAFGRLLGIFAGPLVVLVDDESELKSALRAGATLALRKPFDPEHLVLAIHAVLGRAPPLQTMLAGGAFVGDLVVSLSNHTVERDGRRQVLGHGEWQLFAFLMAHPETTFSRDDLARGAWGPGYGGRASQVELYVSRLRRKIERNPHQPEVILTVRREGYRLVSPQAGEFADGALAAASTLPSSSVLYLLGAYRELINVGNRLAEHTSASLGSATAEHRREIIATDLPLFEAATQNARDRITRWEATG